jgi:ketosteroid isomerase-like protein
MSQENVDVIRAVIEAINRNDGEAAIQRMDPGIRFDHRLGALQGNVVGHDGVRALFADFVEHFDSWRIYCEDIRNLGDRVLALGTVRATGKESGAETELPFTVVAGIKDGLVTDYTDYGDRDQALEAAGLEE